MKAVFQMSRRVSIWMLLAAAAPAGATSMTGLVNFSANSGGSFVIAQEWNTRGATLSPLVIDVIYNLYVDAGSGFINHGDGTGVRIDIPLTPGTYTYTIWGERGLIPFSYAGLNIFFNGDDTTPGISVKNALGASGNLATANSSGSTQQLDGINGVAGAGSLVFVDGYTQVKLTSYFWNSPSSAKGDRVNGYNDSPFLNIRDFNGGFTIEVTTPEPAAGMLMLAGLGALAAMRRRLRARAQ